MASTPPPAHRKAPQAGKTCMFCGQSRKMSKEHLWPKWAQGAIAPEHRGQKIRNALYEGAPGEPFREWDAPVFEATLKDVCVECNNGWMSKIEAAAKPIALPLITGRAMALAPESQRKLALWGYLKCSLFLTMERDAAIKRAMAKTYRVFYELQAAGRLPPHCSVFIARHVGKLTGQYQHRLLGMPSRPTAFFQTFTTGELTLQVVRSYLNGPILEVTRDPRVAGRDHRIWPMTGMFTWPPGEPLTDEELTIYTGPQVAGPQPSKLIYPR